MFARLDSSIRSELTAIDIRETKERERRRDAEELRRTHEADERQRLRDAEELRRDLAEERRRRGESAVTVLTALAVPLGFLVAFFGINADQVKNSYSIWNYHHYWGAYVFALALVLLPFAALSFLRGRDLRRRGH